VGDETHELGAGDAIAFPADQPHSYENAANGEARYHDLVFYER
jgi:quercetin dioxygenase-like cupin family protein